MADESYLNQLRRWDEDELRIAAEHVAQLAEHPGFKALIRLLDEVHGKAMDRLLSGAAGASGHVMEQAEYARLIGFISGLTQPTAATQAFAIADSKRRNRNTADGGEAA